MRNILLISLFLLISLISLASFIGVDKVNKKPATNTPVPHFYENEKLSIKKIKINVIYFVPKDIKINEEINWKNITENHLKNLIDFHSIQFKNTSKISYEFVQKIITGDKTLKEYESLFEYDDNEALTPVKEEITKRLLSPDGDLYAESKIVSDKNAHNVYLIVFEGKGAAGNNDFFLVSRSYLTDNVYKDTGSTFLAHEFYHTLGIPDKYKTSTYVYKDGQQTTVSLVTDKDIMGQVNIPISSTYINNETLKKMGL